MEVNKIIQGDCIEVMKELPDNSVDSIVTDPPYGLEFMGKNWDKFKDGKNIAGGNTGKGTPYARSKPTPAFYQLKNKDMINFQEFTYQWAKEALRVLKPGGFLLSFGGTRTYHRMACAIEDAGFEIRDQIQWLYGSGFPKSLNIGKQIDKYAGRINNDLEKIKLKLRDLYIKSNKTLSQIDKECGFRASGYLRVGHREDDGWGESLPTLEKWDIIKKVINCDEKTSKELKKYFVSAEREVIGKGKAKFLEKNDVFGLNKDGYGDYNITIPATPEAKQWEGWGTALKPANEPIVVARKPLSEKNVALNVLKWGTGGINIDGCRVHSYDEDKVRKGGASKPVVTNFVGQTKEYTGGRFPANIIFECICDEVKQGIAKGSKGHWSKTKTTGFGEFGNGKSEYSGIGPKDDMKCIIHTNPNCPCYMLDEQSGISRGEIGRANRKQKTEKFGMFGLVPKVTKTSIKDIGGASRFFYCAKASKSERNKGLDGFEEKDGACMQWNKEYRMIKNVDGSITPRKPAIKRNIHPTVKPIKLMRYLVRLVTRKGGVVLDPFLGSGTTAIACKLEGMKYIGIEKEPEYVKIAEARIKAYDTQKKLGSDN